MGSSGARPLHKTKQIHRCAPSCGGRRNDGIGVLHSVGEGLTPEGVSYWMGQGTRSGGLEELDGDQVAGVIFVEDLAEENFHTMAFPIGTGRHIGIVAGLG